MRPLAALLLPLLAACAGLTLAPVEARLNALIGQPLDTAVAQLGYPAAERTIAGRRLVIWTNSTTVLVPAPVTATTVGTYGSATTTGMTTRDTTATCKITLEVNEKDLVRAWEIDGNAVGCGKFGR